jgi:hypothetical protein
MVQFVDGVKTTEEQIRDEHNHASGSRKVIGGPLVIPWDADNNRSVAPIVKAISVAAIELVKADGLEHNTTYRVVSPVAGFYLLEGVGTATTNDLYVPAGEVIYLELNKMSSRYSILGEAAGTIQFQEIGK